MAKTIEFRNEFVMNMAMGTADPTPGTARFMKRSRIWPKSGLRGDRAVLEVGHVPHSRSALRQTRITRRTTGQVVIAGIIHERTSKTLKLLEFLTILEIWLFVRRNRN